MQRMQLWERSKAGAARVTTAPPHSLTPRGVRRARSTDRRAGGDACIVFPVRDVRAVAACLLVPVRWTGRVTCDDAPLEAGAHALAHGAEIALGDTRAWVALAPEVEITPYDPGLHGEGRACYRTRAPLIAGESIALCPGVPGEPCACAYALPAWEALERCPACGHRPAAPPWTPPLPAPSRRGLLRRLRGRGA